MAFPKQRREDRKEINTDQVVAFLTSAFSRATRCLGFKNHRGTDLHHLQCELAWMLHDIATGPRYIVPKHIQTANEFIDQIYEDYSEDGNVNG